jgi:RecJ-like exonuclease
MSGTVAFWLVAIPTALVLVILFGLQVQRANKIDAAQRVADQEVARVAAEKAKQIVCQHCQTKGFVTIKEFRQKQGVSGGKATAAVLTGGLSVVATGLSRHGWVTKANCSNCGTQWIF